MDPWSEGKGRARERTHGHLARALLQSPPMQQLSPLSNQVRPLICPQVVRRRNRHESVRTAVCMDDVVPPQRLYALIGFAVAGAMILAVSALALLAR
jgi:hypothetical protein